MQKDKTTENFCRNIKKLREQQGLSKKNMAERLGIGVRSLSLLESGILPPRLSCDVLWYIYDHFGISPQEIFGENCNIFKTAQIKCRSCWDEPDGVCDTPNGQPDAKT